MKNNTIIFGDSYSTFDDCIPDGYEVYYYKTGREETDVTKVEETWWHQVVKNANLNLVLNDSWSGSTIGYTGYNNADCSKTSSFICRLNKLIDNGFFEQNEIHNVFIFGATNDSWANVPLGNVKFDDFKDQDLHLVLPAICYFIKRVRDTLPSANIYCLINTELKPEIAECFEKACEQYGAVKVNFEKIDMNFGHPTIKGMQDIANTVLKVING